MVIIRRAGVGLAISRMISLAYQAGRSGSSSRSSSVAMKTARRSCGVADSGGGISSGCLAETLRCGVAQHRLVEPGLVGEVVVDGGQVGPGAAADVADLRAAKALFREDLARGLDQPQARAVRGAVLQPWRD